MVRSLLVYLMTILSFCYAECDLLSLSGGGSFGSVEAGILDGLVMSHSIPTHFDVITGISAGGLNAGLLHHFDNVSDALPLLKELYMTTKTQDIYESNMMGIFSRWSIYDNSPLEKTLHAILGNTTQSLYPPIVLIGASNLITEELDVFSLGALSFEEKIDVLMSTTAIPLVFPPRSFQNTWYIDGGVISNEMITQAIGEIQCSFYNITHINARPKYKAANTIHGFVSYVSAVVRMLLNTFDDPLAQATSCTFPKGQINACFPISEELNQYSILDFDHGGELYELGRLHHECSTYPLC